MTKLKFIIILLFICMQINISAQNERYKIDNDLREEYKTILNKIPEDFHKKIVLYPCSAYQSIYKFYGRKKIGKYKFVEDSLIFIFKPFDYIKYWLNYLEEERSVKLDKFLIIDKLYLAEDDWTVIRNSDRINHFPNDIIMMQLFKERKIIVLEKVNDSLKIIDYIIIFFDDKKEKYCCTYNLVVKKEKKTIIYVKSYYKRSLPHNRKL